MIRLFKTIFIVVLFIFCLVCLINCENESLDELLSNGLHEHALAVYNNEIYIIGGRDNDYNSLKSIYRYNPQKDEFVKEEVELNIFRQGHTAVLVNNKIYIMGGAKWCTRTPS